jgi:ubiquinone/menaquinone biosynthesis C-methylase UbiE
MNNRYEDAEKLLREHHSKISSIYDKIFHEESEGEFYEMDTYILELLQRWCPESCEEILEVGCGTGYWLEYLSKIRKATLVGVDVSPEMLALAKNRFSGNPRLRLYEGDIRDMIFLENNRFDFVLCAWIFQYLVGVDDFRKGLRELKRVIKPDGIIMLGENIPPTAAPFTDCLLEKDALGGIYHYEDEYEEMKIPVYRRLMSPDEMKALIKKEGLTLLSHGRKISLDVYIVCKATNAEKN